LDQVETISPVCDFSHRSEDSFMSDKSETLQTVKVWDLPTRLFHWTLVALMIAQWLTAEESSTMDYHVWGGYAVLALVLFRLIWGFAGSETARFSDFLRGPGAALEYVKALLRGETPHYLGHNPLGAWSIVAMLVLLLVQAGTGLFANDDILIEGPLYAWVSKDTSDWLTTIHKLNFNLLLLVIAVHLSAVLFYLLVKRENLIHPMLSGRKHLPPERLHSAPRLVSPWLGLAALAVAVAAVWLLVR
jgi:cytochrome b